MLPTALLHAAADFAAGKCLLQIYDKKVIFFTPHNVVVKAHRQYQLVQRY